MAGLSGITPKVINFYSCGDSTNIKTWSNVPFLFARELENRGIKLNRINIEPSPHINRWYNRISYFVFQRILHKNACPIFSRSWLHRFLINRKLRKVARLYDEEVSINLFLSYLFRNQYSIHPSVLWCDWSDAIVIERIGRDVKRYERRSLNHEANVIQSADAVYTMFPRCSEKMSQMYGRNIRYLGVNVVNTLYDKEINIRKLVKLHEQSDYILFIGNHRYQEGAKKLIEAVTSLRLKGYDIKVDIIGMQSDHIPGAPDWVRFHGYLDKSDLNQRKVYYDLIFSARLLVNTTSGWAGYSSIIEAMYYATPIIVTPFDDFVAEFGDTIDFGEYCAKEANLSTQIEGIIESPSYQSMCETSHRKVEKYTWSNYVDAFLADLNSIGIFDVKA